MLGGPWSGKYLNTALQAYALACKVSKPQVIIMLSGRIRILEGSSPSTNTKVSTSLGQNFQEKCWKL